MKVGRSYGGTTRAATQTTATNWCRLLTCLLNQSLIVSELVGDSDSLLSRLGEKRE